MKQDYGQRASAGAVVNPGEGKGQGNNPGKEQPESRRANAQTRLIGISNKEGGQMP